MCVLPLECHSKATLSHQGVDLCAQVKCILQCFIEALKLFCLVEFSFKVTLIHTPDQDLYGTRLFTRYRHSLLDCTITFWKSHSKAKQSSNKLLVYKIDRYILYQNVWPRILNVFNINVM